MPRKLGKSAVDLFKKTEVDQPTQQAEPPRQTAKLRRKRRPRVSATTGKEQASVKVTFLLTPSQTTFLDEICLKIKKNNGRSMRRTEVVRALLDVLRSLKIDCDKVESEEQLRERILDYFS